MALSDGLQRYYPLDGNGDDVHGGVHGVISGPSPAFETGHVSALALNLGSNANNRFVASPFGGTDLSASFWIYSISLASFCTAVGNMTAGAVTSDWCFLVTGPQTLTLYQNANSSSGASAAPLAVNGWSHVVVTRAGTSLKVYRDGALVASATVGVTNPASDSFYIGCRPDSFSMSNARFQEVALWNRALTADEVTEIFNGGDGLAYDDIAGSPAPEVAAVDPVEGPEAGGTEVTITGSNFIDGASVRFGDTSSPSVEFVSDTELIAIAPAGSGLVDVTVINPDDQTGTLGVAFNYIPPPDVESVAPSSGTEEGGTAITITGTGFQDGATVTIGGVAATSVVFVGATELTAVTPAGSPGVADVVVTNPDEQSGTLAGFVYLDAPLEPEADALIKLLPPGRLWLLEIGSALRNLLRGIADEFKRVRLRAIDLLNEADPRTASETLTDWERVLSLPDDLVTEIPATIAGRQVAVTQKYIARGASNDAFYSELCAACGYPLLSITRHAEDVLRSGDAESGSPVVDVGDSYTITLELDTPTAGALTEEQFESVVRARTHSHIQVVFTYT